MVGELDWCGRVVYYMGGRNVATNIGLDTSRRRLSALLTLLSPHYLYHTLAQSIISNLFLPQWAHRLNTYLGGTHNELTLVTLKLFYALSCFANGRERKSLFDVFAWESKSLPKMLHMRRKGRTDEGFDILSRPDIRTFFVLFLLSFVDAETQASVKSAFLEQRRDIFSSIFRGLWQDPYSVIRRVLEICWMGIWSDPKVKRTLKVHVFNETVLTQLARIYDRNSSEDGVTDHVPADVAHHFLLAICTRPGVGICFKDRGWYPRDVNAEDSVGLAAVDDAEDFGSKKPSKINNKILANVLKTLKVNEDPRQQELALKVIAACPELVAGYVRPALPTPPLSKWIANIAFFGLVISLPHLHPAIQPCPPAALRHHREHPAAVNIKAHLSRGLQAPSPLVRHCTALALAKCMLKYDAVLCAFHEVERALEEDADGQWARRRGEVEREIRKRVPDFQVVLGFAQKSTEAASTLASSGVDAEGDMDMEQKTPAANPVRSALLAESAQRLLWLYHRCMPALVAEARFDVGKLLLSLQNVVDRPIASTPTSARTDGLDVLRQLHVLRLLSESDQFNWSGKAGGSHSNLYVLLKMYATTGSPAIRTATATILRQSLSTSLLFQHDSDELVLWLRSLPITVRPTSAQAPDGAPLSDERDAVIAFLDDCAQHCAKTPYRYLEELQSLCFDANDEDINMDGANGVVGSVDNESLPSPLLITVAEHFTAKLRGNHISPSDALAIATFMRKLVYRLMSKTCQLGCLTRCRALRMASLAKRLGAVELAVENCKRPSNRETLTQAEASPIPERDIERRMAAFELIDWSRFVQRSLLATQVTRLITAVERLYEPALPALLEGLRPDLHCLWTCIDVPVRFSDLQEELSFEVLFAHCGAVYMQDSAVRETLTASLVSKTSTLLDITRGVVLINHRLRTHLRKKEERYARDVLLLLTHLAQNSTQLVERLFETDSVKQLCEKPLSVMLREGLSSLLECSFPSASAAGRHHIASGFGRFWSLRASVENLSDDEIETTRLWIPYADPSDLVALLDHFADKGSLAAQRADIVEEALRAIASGLSAVQPKASTVASLHLILPHSTQLERILGSLLHDQLPLCYDGIAPGMGDADLRAVIAESTRRWSRCTVQPQSFVSIDEVLKSQQWSDATANIVVSLVYRQPSARGAVLKWLQDDVSTVCTTYHLARVLFALVDRGFLAASAGEDVAHLVQHHRKVNTEHTGRLCTMYIKTACALIEQVGPIRGQLLAVLQRECEKQSSNSVSFHLTRVLAILSPRMKTDVADIAEELMAKALPWAVQLLSSGEALTSAETEVLADLGIIAKAVSPRSHLVEPVLTAVAQQRLGDVSVIHFAGILVQATSLKPFTVNKFLQSIVQHPQLYAFCGQDARIRDAIADVLFVLFRLHPSNACQPTHIEPLLRLYTGSLSAPDTKILYIFRLFESTRKTSCSTLLSRWSSPQSGLSSTALDALLSLDPNRVLKTCLDFPQYRRMLANMDDGQAAVDAIYDPVFILLLLSQTLSSSPPTSALNWVQLFRTNVVSLLIRAVSAKDEQLRDVALAQLAALHKTLQDADMQEQPHVLYILNMLKDALAEAPKETVPRLPAFTSLILAHALRAMFYPSNFIYPLTARFLLQRDKLDTSDVPMLFGMLYSSSDQWKKERGWIVRFLSDAMVGSDEWRILQRRHTWDLLASLYQSEERDRALRRGILEVLANITCNARATTSLILKSALLPWIEMQVKTMGHDEGLAWAKTLANVVASVDSAKIEAATSGEWRLVLGRCIHTILTSSACTSLIFPYLTDVLLRVALLPGSPTLALNRIVGPCLSWLTKMEEGLNVNSAPPLSVYSQDQPSRHLPPHSSHGLFDHGPHDAVQEWGECVERLWRTCMVQDVKCVEWDALTHRLLVWNAVKVGEQTVVGEWARQEVVQNLASV
ncbi:ribosome 60S biogenesis N-terminal-domain-containing protein [Fomitopsis serialis]|uniref:ribosome 60S biogenesis N-terminal-domain-containing protein n=1 Tax=Fomitopsis serialis TaxID=139415 RepID=UPI002008E13A|nr:ribosome 60S biogenesis N-terminal-domain-containing protein [Neoantrodia serialis]KAH9916809.1 ribosome 60S biogenesis N-terminal-domain-containing protein [Neoantrodia serialis]